MSKRGGSDNLRYDTLLRHGYGLGDLEEYVPTGTRLPFCGDNDGSNGYAKVRDLIGNYFDYMASEYSYRAHYQRN